MDSFNIFLVAIVGVIAGLACLVVFVVIRDEIQWIYTPSFRHEAYLVQSQFMPSTRQSHLTPVFHSKGVAFAVTETGHDKIHSTVWDLGKYGRMDCNNTEIWRWAQPKSILLLKEKENRIRIVGIVH